MTSTVVRHDASVPAVRQIPESLRRVGRALDELRERGQDRDWLEALLDYLHDLQTRRSPTLEEGLQQLGRGELELA